MGKFNVILLTVDCLRADHLGCYGYDEDTSPNIDSLAADGLLWTRCYSTGPRTNESFPGIVSGALSADCGYAGDSWHRTPPTPTSASWLSSEGYHTAARLSNPQLSRRKRYDHGFDSFENLAVGSVGWGDSDTGSSEDDDDRMTVLDRAKESLPNVHEIRSNLRHAHPILRRALYTPLFAAYREYQRRTGWPIVDGKRVARELLRTLESGDQPFFRWAHFNDIHAPIHPSRVNRSGLHTESTLRQYLGDAERIRQSPSETYERMYDAMVRYVDSQIGVVTTELRERGLWENSIVIVTADHGEALYDRGINGHASGLDRYLYDETRDYMYDELLHVPLVVSGGAISESNAFSRAVSTAWINELIAELADVSAGEFVRRSGSNSIVDSEEETIVLSDALTEKGHTFAAHLGEYKLITKSLSPGDDVLDGALAFDLSEDPAEREVLDPAEVPRELPEAIRGNVRRIEDLPDVSRGRRVSDETKELLEQLGYAE